MDKILVFSNGLQPYIINPNVRRSFKLRRGRSRFATGKRAVSRLIENQHADAVRDRKLGAVATSYGEQCIKY